MTTLRSIALVAVASSAIGLAGCGGDGEQSASSGGSTDAKTLLVSTFQPSQEGSRIRSGTIEIKLSGKASGLDGTASAKIAIGKGKDGELPDFQADIAVDGKQSGGGDFKLNAGGTHTGGRFYVSYDGDNYDVGEELSKRVVDSMKQATKQSGGQQDQGQIVAQLGLNPETWLIDPKVSDDEQIGGVDTYKITGEVDVKALVPDILEAARKAQSLTGPAGSAQRVPEVTEQQLDEVSKQIKELDVAIWTGKDDNILRQITVDMKVDDEKAKDSLDGSMQLTLTGVNEDQKISAPSDTKPITDLMPKLSGLLGAASGLGGLGGGVGGPPSGGAASGGAAPSVSDEYLKCVNAAGSDPAKLNACQAKLAP